MLGILYLLIAMLTGFALVLAFVPRVFQKKILTTAGEHSVNPFFTAFPACFLSGVLTLTWATYLVGCLFRRADRPLTIANAICMPAFAVLSIVLIVIFRKRIQVKSTFRSMVPGTSEMVYLAASLSVAVVLMIASFRVVDQSIAIANPVIEDYALHVNLIRSVSEWQNVPMDYPYYTNAGINYHFMFDFLAGNLELLGMRIDHAFNVPAVLAMLAMFCGIYACFFRLCGRRNYCHLVWLLVMFRPSLALWEFYKENKDNFAEAFHLNNNYFGATVKEWWGIYQQNAFINQRHLIFGFAAAFFAISLFLPYLIKGINERKKFHSEKQGAARLLDGLCNQFVPTRKATIMTGVFAGLVLGMTGFWNAHSVVSALLVLAVMAVFSTEMAVYALTAGIAGFLTVIQATVFAGESEQFGIRFTYGYILEDRSLLGHARFLWLMFGLMIPVIILYAVFSDAVHRVVLVTSLMPMVFAFHVQLSPAMVQNHKFVLFSIYWIGLQGGIALCRFLSGGRKKKEKKSGKAALVIARALLVLVLLVPLTATGVADFYMILDKCDSKKAYCYESDPPLLRWAREAGVTKDTVFLAPDNFMSQMNTAGLQNSVGYRGMVKNAGYDFDTRMIQTWDLVYSETREEILAAAAECGANYLILQHRTRAGLENMNEELINQVFPKVFSMYSGDEEYCVFDLEHPMPAGG